MHILIVNPVANGATKDAMYIRRFASPGTEISVCDLPRGPLSVESFYDETVAAPEVVALLKERHLQADAFVINCFADPGLDAARELIDRPVLGAGETSMFLALRLGHRFSVISVLPSSGPWTERYAMRLGIAGRLASATGVDIGVRSLLADESRTVSAIVDKAREAVARHGAEVIVLGCTGMALLAAQVREEVAVPVVEPTAATVKMAELLVSVGLTHHRGGLYQNLDLHELRDA